MKPLAPYVNIHTHRPVGRGIELRVAGVHPWEAGQQTAEALPRIDPEVQALGEIGLDFVRDVARDAQLQLFRKQLELAQQLRLPVVLHCVRAFNEVMRELAGRQLPAVIFHGFVGSSEQARQAVRAGYWISFGERSFRSPKSVEAMRTTPLAQLFLETDESETPIESVYRQAAALLEIPEEALREATYENYNRIFAKR